MACQLEQSSIKIKDCGHMCLCLECTSIIGRKNPKCPLCRKEMINFCFMRGDFFIEFYLSCPVDSPNYDRELWYAFVDLPLSTEMAIGHIKRSQPDYIKPQEVLTEEQEIQLNKQIDAYLEQCAQKYHDVEITQESIDTFTRVFGYHLFSL